MTVMHYDIIKGKFAKAISQKGPHASARAIEALIAKPN